MIEVLIALLIKGPHIIIHKFYLCDKVPRRGMSFAPRWSTNILLELRKHGSNNHVAKEDIHNHKYKKLSCSVSLNH